MAEILPHICSLSQQLHQSNEISDQDYDKQVHDLLAYLKQTIPNEVSHIISKEVSFLDVRGSINIPDGRTNCDITGIGAVTPFSSILAYLACSSPFSQEQKQ